VDEVGGEISEDCISHLTPVARGRSCDIIQDYWDDDDQTRFEQGYEDYLIEQGYEV